MKIIYFFKKIPTILLLVVIPLNAIDNPHFWRATNFLPAFYEPRFERDWLLSLDATVGFGSTTTARNGNGTKVPLLDIYGTYNMQALGINVPGKNLTNPADIALTQLELLPANEGFAQLSFEGRFKLLEANLSLSQNIGCGFFIQGHIPVRQIQITDITQRDLSPLGCDNGPNINTPEWQNFLALFPQILDQYNLSIAPFKHSGVGDLSILLGWTNNYEETQEIDYVDTTFRIGALFPTGRKKNEDLVFDIANGYNGHYAIPISIDFAIGWYDWFTLGADFGVMTFFKKTRDIRLRTDCLQSGLITLTKAPARIDPGNIWEANVYMKADHVLCGFSVLLGYSFAMQEHFSIIPQDTIFFDPVIVNSDERFLGWKMHTINLLLDWDFATYECPSHPHVGVFGNFVVGGERIFNTHMGGFAVGIHFIYDF